MYKIESYRKKEREREGKLSSIALWHELGALATIVRVQPPTLTLLTKYRNIDEKEQGTMAI
jgi:hypothetical protein